MFFLGIHLGQVRYGCEWLTGRTDHSAGSPHPCQSRMHFATSHWSEMDDQYVFFEISADGIHTIGHIWSMVICDRWRCLFLSRFAPL